jgi:hypothetical protein
MLGRHIENCWWIFASFFFCKEVWLGSGRLNNTSYRVYFKQVFVVPLAK